MKNEALSLLRGDSKQSHISNDLLQRESSIEHAFFHHFFWTVASRLATDLRGLLSRRESTRDRFEGSFGSSRGASRSILGALWVVAWRLATPLVSRGATRRTKQVVKRSPPSWTVFYYATVRLVGAVNSAL